MTLNRMLGVTLVVVGILVAVVVGFLLFTETYVEPRISAEVNRKRCSSNLKQIGVAFGRYRQSNEQLLPDRDGTAFVSRLFELGLLEEPEFYICWGDRDGVPGARGKPLVADSCSYVGRRNRGPDRVTPELVVRAASWTPLAADRSIDHHLDGRIVLFADGHVEEVPEEAYQRLYASAMGE